MSRKPSTRKPQATKPQPLSFWSTTIVDNGNGTFSLDPNNIPMTVGDFLQINGDPNTSYDLKAVITPGSKPPGSVNVHS
jgi:hypothetical protein